jgi:hypothetical protein
MERLVPARIRALGLEQHPRRPRHRLHAAHQHQVGVAGLHGPARLHRGIQRGAAQPVDGVGGHAGRQPGQQHRHPPDVAVVLAGAVGVAERDVVDARRIELRRACKQRPDRVRGQVVRAHAGERAPRAPERRPHRIEDQRLGAHVTPRTRRALPS